MYGLPDIHKLQNIIHHGAWWVFDTNTFPPSSLLTLPHHGGILSLWEYAGKPPSSSPLFQVDRFWSPSELSAIRGALEDLHQQE